MNISTEKLEIGQDVTTLYIIRISEVTGNSLLILSTIIDKNSLKKYLQVLSIVVLLIYSIKMTMQKTGGISMTKRYFKSIGEMAQAIYDGKDVCAENGTKLTYMKECECPWRYGSVSLTSGWKHWQECYELVDWKESVSEENPRLCFVSNASEEIAKENKIVRVVTKFDSEHSHPFRFGSSGWKYAVPVRQEEVLKWLVDNEE